jgi:hypothetical protein
MATSRSFFSDAQIELVTEVLNRIIPANEELPGAGEIAVNFLDEVVGGSPRLKRILHHGLSQIEVCAYRMYTKDFPSLSCEQMHAVLRQVEVDEGEFFDLLVRQTYNGYYTDPRIVELLGLEARPPQPLGHRVDQGNITLIESVKNRGIVYREV